MFLCRVSGMIRPIELEFIIKILASILDAYYFWFCFSPSVGEGENRKEEENDRIREYQ